MNRTKYGNSKDQKFELKSGMTILLSIVFLSCLLFIALLLCKVRESNSAGEVYISDELKFEVVSSDLEDASVTVILLVTATQLESVIVDCGWENAVLNNYRFDGVTNGTLFSSATKISETYLYNDSEPNLADNQFYLMIEILPSNHIEGELYTIELQKFGTYVYEIENTDSNSIGLTSLYEGPWVIDICF